MPSVWRILPHAISILMVLQIVSLVIQKKNGRTSHSTNYWGTPAFHQWIKLRSKNLFSELRGRKLKIDKDELINGSKYFRWGEVLWLRQWGVHVIPSDDQYLGMLAFVKKMDYIRKYLGVAVIIKSGIRPHIYNQKIGGSFYSAHRLGQAVDFYTKKISADRIREILLPILDDLNIRMEDLPGSNWVHIDNRDPGSSGKRFFKP